MLFELALVPLLGIFAVWLGWRVSLPSILVLLVFGIFFGPVTGVINPEHIMGELLFPFVSISVAIIMFEGGLSLKLSDIKNNGNVVWNLVSIGNVITWAILSFSMYKIFNCSAEVALLTGSILCVTGPTVVTPLLRYIRPSRQVASVLRWEGIVIDPIVAVQSLLLFDLIKLDILSNFREAIPLALMVIGKTLGVGFFLGILGAVVLIYGIKKGLIPEFLQENITLVLVITVYVLSNLVQAESGLLTVTIMGIIITNQSSVTIQQIIHFKENLTVILLASLFILLSARLELNTVMNYLDLKMVLFLCIVIFVARPVSVMVSSMGSGLTFRERNFISWMAPRGLVAAAVASLFSFRLEGMFPDADLLVSVTFTVIIVTVLVYGLTSRVMARFLNVVRPRYQGVLFVGAHSWAREIARFIQKENIPVFMVDTNRDNIRQAESEGLPYLFGSIHSQNVLDVIQYNGIGKLIAITQSDDLNRKAVQEFSSAFGVTGVYRLFPTNKKVTNEETVRKERFLFSRGLTWSQLDRLFANKAVVRRKQFRTSEKLMEFIQNHTEIIPMFVVTESGKLFVCTPDRHIFANQAKVLVYLRPTLEQGLTG